MLKIKLAVQAGLSSALLAVCLAPMASAQTAPANAAAGQPGANDAFLAKAGGLYYSTVKAGLTGFDCAVHPDWADIFKTVMKSSDTAAAQDPKVALLNSVNITLHARLSGGGSGLDWNPPAPATPLDADSSALLDKMHQGTAQTLQGFLQFWAPFVNGSVIPESGNGIDITKTATGHTIHAVDGTTDLTEVLDSSDILKEFNVQMGGTKINFDPSYKPTPNGLLVSSFTARIQPAGAPPEKAQLMNVGVDYQTVKGLLVPHKLSMDIVGTGQFTFLFDGCTVNPPAQ